MEANGWERVEAALPKILSEICANGLKGEINSFAEATLAIKLSKLLSVSSWHVQSLVSQNIMQSFADILLQCKASSLRIQIIDAVNALIVQEEALDAFQKQALTIVNKPEIVVEEKKKDKHKSKDKEDEKQKSREPKKSKDKDRDKKKHKHGGDKRYLGSRKQL